VSEHRDFPRGNPEARAPGSSRASSHLALPLAVASLTHSSLQLSFHASTLPFYENPNFLSPAFGTFVSNVPSAPLLLLLGSRHTGWLTAPHTPCSPGFHPPHVLPWSPEPCTPWLTVSLLLSLQTPVQMSPLWVSDLSRECESLLPLGSILPPQHTAQVVFLYVLKQQPGRDHVTEPQ
jgi:hypothetical protein